MHILISCLLFAASAALAWIEIASSLGMALSDRIARGLGYGINRYAQDMVLRRLWSAY